MALEPPKKLHSIVRSYKILNSWLEQLQIFPDLLARENHCGTVRATIYRTISFTAININLIYTEDFNEW